jgi:ferredoxin
VNFFLKNDVTIGIKERNITSDFCRRKEGRDHGFVSNCRWSVRTNQRGGIMAFIITSDCNLCDKCVEPCPNDAISEGDDIYIIDPDKCTECVGFYGTPQCADVCPVDACVTDPDRQEAEDELLVRAKALHPEKEFASGYPTQFRN